MPVLCCFRVCVPKPQTPKPKGFYFFAPDAQEELEQPGAPSVAARVARRVGASFAFRF